MNENLHDALARKYCLHKSPHYDGFTGVFTHCALPPGHTGPHQDTTATHTWENDQ